MNRGSERIFRYGPSSKKPVENGKRVESVEGAENEREVWSNGQ
jgi:hypothetical protein